MGVRGTHTHWNSKEIRFVLHLLALFYQGKGMIKRAIDRRKKKTSHPLSELIRGFNWYYAVVKSGVIS